MKAHFSLLLLLAVLLASSLTVVAQTPASPTEPPSSASDLEQLKAQMNAQQKLLEKQQAHIQALQSAVDQQQLLIIGAAQNAAGARLVPAVDRTVDLRAADYSMQGAPQENQALPADQQPQTAEEKVVQEELQRGPEIADVTPDTPALKLGPAKVRLIGYPAMTMVWRSANSGGNVGTSFAGIPYDNSVAGNLTEFRVSPQSSRLALRVDADLKDSKAAGYFEMDFGGCPSPATSR